MNHATNRLLIVADEWAPMQVLEGAIGVEPEWYAVEFRNIRLRLV